MLAPLLMVQSADPDGSDRPILSLDESRIVQNYWSAALPPGVGHLTRVLEHPVSGPDKVTTYIYDHATSGDRLRKVTYPNARWVEYFYDAVGNRTFTVTNGVQVDYTANDLNQYTSVGGVAFQYDADGNLTFDGVRTFEYDAQSRLVQETGPEGVTEYEYDALGNRTATVLNGQRTEYLLDPTGMVSVLAEHNELNQLIARNVHGLGLVARLGERGALSFYDFDALGSAIAVTAEAGSVLSRSAYTPFGEMLAQSGSPASPFEFVGQFGVTHEVNGLYFMRARYYDSRLGRFVTKDPIDLQAGDLNLYRYVLNSPVVLSDPSGLIPGVAEAPGAWGDIAGGLVVVVGTAFAIGTAPLATVLLGFLAGYIAIAAGLYQLAFPPSPSCSCTAPASGGPGSVALASDGGSGSANGGAVARCLCYPNSGGGQGAGGSSPIPGPQDPNKKTGPAGFGSAGFVLPDTVLPYRIDFENEPSATAPAQQVVVADALSPSLDSSTLEWTEIGWGDQFILVPPNTRHFETNVAVAIGGTSFEVHIELGFRPASNQAYAIFRSIDPDTSLPPPVETGFLPPEDGTGRGQGHVSYTVHAKAGLPTGREIRNVALIEFDRQPAIATNQRDPHNPGAGTDPTLECLNTIDAGTPVSLVQPLPPVVSRSFLVQWFGSDDGSGIVTYDVDVSTNGIDFTGWLERTPATEAAFVGVLGQTYYFRCRARDGVGHEEAVHAFADAFATVGEDFEASLGALILPAGQRGRLPIGLVSSEALSRFGLTLELPADGPIDPGVRVPESAAGLVCDAAIEPLADRVYRVNVAACDGQGLRGMQPVAWLYLTAASNQPSAVLTVHSRDLVGRKPDGTPATNLDAELGRVVVLGEAPLLEALRTPDGQPTLVLYGRLGTECTLEFNPDLGQPLAWQPTWQGRMTNLYLSFPTPGGLARAGFFRARVR
jgi:RHS repeat-associated protein